MELNEFLEKVRSRAGLANLDEALYASRATLETLSERLSGTEPGHLEAQLPTALARFMEIDPHRRVEPFSAAEFFHRIGEREGIGLDDATAHAKAVLGVLGEAVAPGEIMDIRRQLSNDYQAMFTAADENRLLTS